MFKTIQLVTLGCSKNIVDSEHLLRQIFNAGIKIVPEGKDLSIDKPDAIILNTCGFIKDAKIESIEAILQAVEAKKLGYTKKVFVFGCLSQRYREELKKEIPEVDGFFGVFDAKLLLQALGPDWDTSLDRSRYLTTPSHYAYLKISEGCDRVCSYCSIPLIRGGYISLPIDDLIEEAKFLAHNGVKELIVIAQDTTYYGLDLYKERRLATLLEQLCDIAGIEWVRLLYCYPASFPESVLDVMASNPKMCKYLDIPLQHINDRVLSNMRRSIDGNATRKLVENFRKRVPGIVLRTTMIVGHPGETTTAFKELCNFILEAKFERLGAFTYSQEEGTWGANNLRDAVSKRVKQERYDELMGIQSVISYNYNLSRRGSKERIIIDSLLDGVYIGRSMSESPEVDGEILVGAHSLPKANVNKNIIGTFANVQIENADEYDLSALFI
ncbi:MAG: 30S ribosomal protein S12 methylthiotransferase RimO [Bacteroidales bacterium]